MSTLLKRAVVCLLGVAVLSLLACSKSEQSQEGATAEAGGESYATPQEDGRGTASAKFGEIEISINYGRPELKGRDMLAQATEGMVWRMGKDEATEITTSADLKFGDTIIPKGKYSLWMRKGSGDKWELLFNEKTGIWGAPVPKEGVIAAIPMTASELPDTVETFTIEISAADATNGEISAKWAAKKLSAKFVVQTAN